GNEPWNAVSFLAPATASPIYWKSLDRAGSATVSEGRSRNDTRFAGRQLNTVAQRRARAVSSIMSQGTALRRDGLTSSQAGRYPAIHSGGSATVPCGFSSRTRRLVL